jgi:Skp family chaperone for outer membrane proteins
MLCSPILSIAQKGTNVAYIQETKILEELEDYKQQVKIIDSLKQSFRQDVKDKTDKLNLKLQGLLSNYEVNQEDTMESIKAKLNEEDKERFTLYMEENKLLEEYSKNYESILQTKYQQNIQPILKEVNDMIITYAKSNKIHIVHKLEGMQVAYIDEDLNITEDILKEIRKRNK